MLGMAMLWLNSICKINVDFVYLGCKLCLRVRVCVRERGEGGGGEGRESCVLY